MDLILAKNNEKTIGVTKDEQSKNRFWLEIITDKRHMMYRVAKNDLLNFLNGKITAKDLYLDTACIEKKTIDDEKEYIYPSDFDMEDLMEIPCADKKVNYSMFKHVKDFIEELA